MLCFELLINGGAAATAAVDADGVLGAIVSWVTPNPHKRRDEGLTVDLGGISGGNHVRWLKRDLRVGDEVTVRIVERDAADEPVIMCPAGPVPVGRE